MKVYNLSLGFFKVKYYKVKVLKKKIVKEMITTLRFHIRQYILDRNIYSKTVFPTVSPYIKLCLLLKYAPLKLLASSLLLFLEFFPFVRLLLTRTLISLPVMLILFPSSSQPNLLYSYQ